MKKQNWIANLKLLFGGMLLSLCSLVAHAAEIAGDWSGTLVVNPAVKLPLVIHLQDKESLWQGSLDSPAQGAFAIPMSRVQVDGKNLAFEIASLNASYRGTFDPQSGKIRGAFTQGQPFELEFSRAVESSGPVRPQTPVAPFPYVVEEVQLSHPAAGIRLAGTLTRPAGHIKAAAILITGSGPQDRDETIAGHKPFAVIADHLSRAGFAVLRLDDRGVGKSTGTFATATSEDFAGDISAAVDYLQGRKDIPSRAIGLIGHSEGGMIAPMVASQRKDLAFVIMMAAPGVDIVDLYIEQRANIFRSLGVQQQSLEKIRGLDRSVFEQINQLPAGESLTAETLDMLREISRATGVVNAGDIDGQVAALAETYASPWFRYFLQFDPQPYIRALKIPVLAFNGSLDIQVSAPQNLAGIRTALQQSQHRDFEVVELKGLNHLLQSAETGAVSEYGLIQETISPRALNLMSSWLDKRFSPSES
ncbi:alpha/beta fold hydrolase [Microbulbifer bruguierae]|uniref:Alpha/beta fold hydrolase n=1 Tax=Microbulbifer bruguierae TaxID=3029061 RepID=A0ABY8NAN1_9GAMM|nr:alpha/beta fold hydrolase [Microbulbifer bruguierae]WGL15142.1 alpha/beta fold hydrolase [Microbulbifer bruguierae]